MGDDCLHYLQAKLWILCFLCRLRKLQTCTASFVRQLAWSGQTDRLVALHHTVLTPLTFTPSLILVGVAALLPHPDRLIRLCSDA